MLLLGPVELETHVRDEVITRQALEATIKIGVVALLALWCYQIVRPFIQTILWAVIIAVAVFPLYRRLRAGLGERPKLAALGMTLALLLLMVLPVVLLISLLADNLQVLAQQLHDGTVRLPSPPPNVETWPVVGAPIHKFWSLAAGNLSAAIEQLAPQLREMAGPLLAAAAAVGLSMLEFALAVVLAGIFLAYSEGGYRLSRAIGMRLGGPQGVELVGLGEETMRSVARGVLGVAVIQAMMAGLGMVIVGVPFAGVWTVVALLLGVLQVGVGLVLLPAVIYVFSTHDTAPATAFMIWSLITTVTDNVLKPLLLGRGLDVPMSVIFVGAIGGMLTAGIIGLFVGAMLLALGYKVFLAWLEMPGPPAAETASPETPAG